MVNRKQTKEEEGKVWVVVGTNGFIESRPTPLTALSLAKSCKESNDEEEWYVFEVTKSWVMEIGEPRAEEIELGFDELP